MGADLGISALWPQALECYLGKGSKVMPQPLWSEVRRLMQRGFCEFSQSLTHSAPRALCLELLRPDSPKVGWQHEGAGASHAIPRSEVHPVSRTRSCTDCLILWVSCIRLKPLCGSELYSGLTLTSLWDPNPSLVMASTPS
jgi:hypothetical protein